MDDACRASPIAAADSSARGGRRRRSNDEIALLREIIVHVVSENAPMTVRQVFYQLVGLGVIDKTERECNDLVVRQLTELRLEGIVPRSWITDGTRWMHESVRDGSIEEALDATRQHHRRDYRRELDE